MRQSTLETLGLGSVTDIFRNGKLPVNVSDMVDRVFGAPGQRGSLVISGANGIVGAGKLMQLTSRLEPFGVRSISLSRARTADGIGPQYPGLVQALGKERADRVMGNIIRMTYDGTTLPADLKQFRPRILLEAIPEIECVPLPDNAQCCGAAGSQLLSPSESSQLLRNKKLDALIHLKTKLNTDTDNNTNIDTLVTTNIGCALHLAAGLREYGQNVEVLHPVTLLTRQLAPEITAQDDSKVMQTCTSSQASARVLS